MGYRSFFDIDFKATVRYSDMAKGAGISLDEFIANKFKEVCDYEFTPSGFDSKSLQGSLYIDDHVKWYEWETETEKVSLMFPDIEFTVTANREGDDDFQQCFVKNGKSITSQGLIKYWLDSNEKAIKQSIEDNVIGESAKAFFT